jgi:CRISPR-associated endonuclease/helicase Cas3
MNFNQFFYELWNRGPFPWQEMLAERGLEGEWPEAIDLPTASGKTACLDAALFSLAATAINPDPEKRMPRRTWFVVDRRIVVDEAFERAKQLAEKLSAATDGPVKDVADSLRTLSGTGRPLAVARLRGGAWRDDGWARLPSQPAIICSTVDQVGSALLFRPYGHSDRTASLYAGLAAYDSLILLDEAHCAIPFLQTLRAVARFRSERWAAQPLNIPFRFSIMSATPPADVSEDAIFPKLEERHAALNHPILQERFTAHKFSELKTVDGNADEFVAQVASHAQDYAQDSNQRRVAVMVNRVATAEQIAKLLRDKLGSNAHIVLLTGRMRSLDRESLVCRWQVTLKAGSKDVPAKPIILVTTQCLEVGADFSFDALVTECASLDALRQRFGRLNRLGAPGDSHAVILIREQDTNEPSAENEDPIYGRAIFETWKWLNEPDQRKGSSCVDFSIENMTACVNALREQDGERFKQLLAPADDAPILLPAHLDLLCQTSPRPTPEPDVALFLHGKGRGRPEVHVVFRSDLPDPATDRNARATWLEILSLIPPTSPEMLTVPLYQLRRWLAEGRADDMTGDVQGESMGENGEGSAEAACSEFLVWRGRDRSQFTRRLSRILPNDVLVLRPPNDGLQGLGQTVEQPDGLGAGRLDLAEQAIRQARGRVLLRIQDDVLAPEAPHRQSIVNLLDLAHDTEIDPEEIETALSRVLDGAGANAEASDGVQMQVLPDWFRETIEKLLQDKFQMDKHPAGGLILIGKKLRPVDAETEDDPLADDEDMTSRSGEPVILRQHTADVLSVARDFAKRCLPEQYVEACAAAAGCHDLGKLDQRFQIWLRNGDEDEVTSEPLAKSARLPERYRRRIEVREDARLPEGFRHEFLSLQLAEHFGITPNDAPSTDLALHLISSHHGHARPFAPIVPDRSLAEAQIAEISLAEVGIDATLTADERKSLPPAHRLDSGVADRFWRLTRRYGWWGLSYIESILRLADWEASRRPGRAAWEDLRVSPSPIQHSLQRCNTLMLDGLDGGNPLAFLSALGTLRLLTRLFPMENMRLSWNLRLGAWRPLLSMQTGLNRMDIAVALTENGVDLGIMFSPELLAASERAGPTKKTGEDSWKDRLRFPVSAYRRHCEQAVSVASIVEQHIADFAAAWAGETAIDSVGKVDVARRTRFDFTAGNQALIDMFRAVRGATSKETIERSLFDHWSYIKGVSLRWDPQDEKRQWALQAIDPKNNSKNPPLADAGANFLAVEALPLFPLVPDRWAAQPGFSQDAEGRSWRWPIWLVPLGLDTVRSLLTAPLAQAEQWPAEHRREFGVEVIFESRIVMPSGRYRCFTPARAVW